MVAIIGGTGGRVTKFKLDRAQKNLPQSLFCEDNHLPAQRPPRLLSAQGYAPSLESSFSGITYHLARAALLTRHMEGCFSLYSSGQKFTSVKLRGALWKAARLLSRQKSRGFKFTSDYLDDVWPKYIDNLAGVTLISNFQMYGREFFKRRKQLDIGRTFTSTER